MPDSYDQFGKPPAGSPTNQPMVRDALPQWRLLLHDDEVMDRAFTIDTITECTPLSHAAATRRVIEAHRHGVAMLLLTHRELAELFYVQLSKQNLIVSLEPNLGR